MPRHHHNAMPTLVPLPGMDGTGELFEPFVEAIGDEFKILIVRYPADRVIGYAELVELVRRALPTDEPYTWLVPSAAWCRPYFERDCDP